MTNAPTMTNASTVTVCVTGAAGQISYSLLPLLASGAVFGPSKRVRLHLLEITPALRALRGVAMELADGAYPLLESVLETGDANAAFEGADVAILVGAFPRKKDMERADLLARNASIFRAQGAALAAVASPDVKVVVVGNPANTNALILADAVGEKIPIRNITALTRLDHNRTRALVAERVGVPVSKVKGVCIWGNHSSTQYPDVLRATVDGKQVADKLGGPEKIAAGLIPVVQKRGAAVISARGFSSAMSAANAIGDHVRSWICGDKEVVSMAVVSDGSYGVPEGIFYSFPCRCLGGGDYEVVKGLEIDPFSREYMDATANELESERAEAMALVQAMH